MDGQGVFVHNGGFTYSFGVGSAKGVVQNFGLGATYISQANFNGFLGMNWVTVLDMQVISAGPDIQMLTATGRFVTFTWNGSGWDPPTGFEAAVLSDPNPGEYLLTYSTGGSVLFVGGRVDTVTDRNGNATTLTWSGGKATKFTDSRGLDHTLSYYSTNRLKELAMDDGRVWTFDYNAADQLTRVHGPTTASFTSGITWEFRYTNGSTDPELNHNMVAAIDGKGQPWLKMTYDQYDRVVTQQIGPGTYAFDYSNIGSQETTVTDPSGAQRVWGWDAGKLTRSSLEQLSNLNVRGTDPTSWDTAWTRRWCVNRSAKRPSPRTLRQPTPESPQTPATRSPACG